jgi:competence protein ComEC
LALRTTSGELALLRPRAGDYVRDLLAEASGAEPDFIEMDFAPGAACSLDLCVATVERAGRHWRILATRSSHLIAWTQMIRACAEADIVIADRGLPKACRPRWLRVDRQFLQRTGGIAVTLGARPRVATVAERVGRHPWAVPTPEPLRRRPFRAIGRGDGQFRKDRGRP